MQRQNNLRSGSNYLRHTIDLLTCRSSTKFCLLAQPRIPGPRKSSKAAATSSEAAPAAHQERTNREAAKNPRPALSVPGEGVPRRSGNPGVGPAGKGRPGQRQPQGYRPSVSALIVVEGPNDRNAVCRAVDARVFELGSSCEASNPVRLRALAKAASGFSDVVFLLDPDRAGRQGRDALEAAFGQKGPAVWHAFVPTIGATAAEATRNHEAGNIGIEHATPEAIRVALQNARPRMARPSQPAFTREDLLALGLVADFQDAGQGQAGRRQLVCRQLGIGDCNGKQLLKSLNSYGFSWEEVEGAVAAANRALEG